MCVCKVCGMGVIVCVLVCLCICVCRDVHAYLCVCVGVGGIVRGYTPADLMDDCTLVVFLNFHQHVSPCTAPVVVL